MKGWIGFEEPGSGWTSLAFSCGGILALVLGVIVLQAGIPGSCDYGGGGCLDLAGIYLPPLSDIGFIFYVLLAPFLFVAGWRIGRRNSASSDSERNRYVISLVPDGRTLGKIGLVTVALTGLAAVGLYIVVGYGMGHCEC